MPRMKGKAADGTYDKETRAQLREGRTAGGRVENLEGRGLLSQGTGVVGCTALVELLRARRDGSLRIVCDEALCCWWKWRFTSGRWEGHYVLVSQSLYQDASATFEALAAKLDLVDAGQLRPSWDKMKHS